MKKMAFSGGLCDKCIKNPKPLLDKPFSVTNGGQNKKMTITIILVKNVIFKILISKEFKKTICF